MNKKLSIDKLHFQPREPYGYWKSIIMTEDNFRQKGAKFQIIYFLGDKQVTPHYHKKTVEVFFVIGGEGIISINDHMNYCKTGDIVVCEPGDIHTFLPILKNEAFGIAIFKTNEEEGDIYNVEI